FHHFIRKGAHFTAYLILGIFAMFAIGRNKSHAMYQISLSFFICLLYAISDEIHQLFIPGRSGEVGDVIIDAVGAFCGIGLYIIFRKVLLKWRASKLV